MLGRGGDSGRGRGRHGGEPPAPVVLPPVSSHYTPSGSSSSQNPFLPTAQCLSRDFDRKLKLSSTPSSSSQPPAPSQTPQSHVVTSSSSKSDRPLARAYHFHVDDEDLHHSDVTISPEAASKKVCRDTITLYRESHLGKCSPAYDGRKSLYSARALPFSLKDFVVKLVDILDSKDRFSRDDLGTKTSVVQYYRERYQINLSFPSLPTLQADCDAMPVYLPMELFKIIMQGQRYFKKLNEKQVTSLLRMTIQRPQDREQSINKMMWSDTSGSEMSKRPGVLKKEQERKVSPVSTLESSFGALNEEEFEVAHTVDLLYDQKSAKFIKDENSPTLLGKVDESDEGKASQYFLSSGGKLVEHVYEACNPKNNVQFNGDTFDRCGTWAVGHYDQTSEVGEDSNGGDPLSTSYNQGAYGYPIELQAHTEEYSNTAVKICTVNPDSIPAWVFNLISSVSPAHKDFQWVLVGKCKGKPVVTPEPLNSSAEALNLTCDSWYYELKDLSSIYEVIITPEVASKKVCRDTISEVVTLYSESHSGKCLPAYDGRKSLYTAGSQPFSPKDFVVKPVNKLDSKDRFYRDDLGTKTSVVQYYRERYQINLSFLSLPALQADCDAMPVYIPMELCKIIIQGQSYSKKLNEKQVTSLLRMTLRRPQDREQSINKVCVRDFVSYNDFASLVKSPPGPVLLQTLQGAKNRIDIFSMLESKGIVGFKKRRIQMDDVHLVSKRWNSEFLEVFNPRSASTIVIGPVTRLRDFQIIGYNMDGWLLLRNNRRLLFFNVLINKYVEILDLRWRVHVVAYAAFSGSPTQASTLIVLLELVEDWAEVSTYSRENGWKLYLIEEDFVSTDVESLIIFHGRLYWFTDHRVFCCSEGGLHWIVNLQNLFVGFERACSSFIVYEGQHLSLVTFRTFEDVRVFSIVDGGDVVEVVERVLNELRGLIYAAEYTGGEMVTSHRLEIFAAGHWPHGYECICYDLVNPRRIKRCSHNACTCNFAWVRVVL